MHVVIIGAGLLGLSTAFHLCERGARVTLIDRNPGPGLETSYANGGLLTPSMAHPWNEPGIGRVLARSLGRDDSAVLLHARSIWPLLGWGVRFLRYSKRERFLSSTLCNAALARYSLEVLDQMSAKLGQILHHSALGTLTLYRTEREFERGVESARHLSEHGIESSALTSIQAAEREPALQLISREIRGAIWFPRDRAGDAYAYCERVSAAISARGGTFLYGATVKGWIADECVHAVRTTASDIEADAFVIAAGSHSPGLARFLGMEIPVQPVKGYSLSFPSRHLAQPPRIPVVDASLHAAITPLESCIRVAGTAEFDGFDLTIRPKRIENLRRLLARVYPELLPLLDRQSAQPWAGLRPMSADGVPILGDTPLPNLYLNTGHGHLGWSMAAASGRLVADRVLGQPTGLDLSPYLLSRFGQS
jgi:D-amino-acid dehydrogenase